VKVKTHFRHDLSGGRSGHAPVRAGPRATKGPTYRSGFSTGAGAHSYGPSRHRERRAHRKRSLHCYAHPASFRRGARVALCRETDQSAAATATGGNPQTSGGGAGSDRSRMESDVMQRIG